MPAELFKRFEEFTYVLVISFSVASADSEILLHTSFSPKTLRIVKKLKQTCMRDHANVKQGKGQARIVGRPAQHVSQVANKGHNKQQQPRRGQIDPQFGRPQSRDLFKPSRPQQRSEVPKNHGDFPANVSRAKTGQKRALLKERVENVPVKLPAPPAREFRPPVQKTVMTYASKNRKYSSPKAETTASSIASKPRKSPIYAPKPSGQVTGLNTISFFAA